MRPILLVAANFLREQRWLTVILVLYALGMAVVFGASGKVSAEDAAFFLRQQSLYAPLFTLFLAVSALHNERKSRRILAVLSKALTRRQYLAGLLVGILAVLGCYCLAIGFSGAWLVRRAQSGPEQLWVVLAVTATATVVVAAVGLFFSTFLAPILATAATALTVALPAALGQALGRAWGNLVPVYPLLMQVAEGRLARHSLALWPPLAIAVVEALLFWALASWIFAHRDVTRAVE